MGLALKYLIIENFEAIPTVANYKLNLLPYPQELGEIRGYRRLGSELGLHFEEVDPVAQETIIEILNEELSAFGQSSIKKIAGTLPKELRTFEELPEKGVEEAYALYFHENTLVIMAISEKGIYYGANTFIQLIKPHENTLIIPNLDIFDYPTYEIRCITDQAGRNQVPTLENLKKVIKFLSKYKINYYFIGYEDFYHFKKYSDIGKSRGGFNHEQIQEIQKYAQRYFMELVPIFSLFGHVENILMTNYPKYARFGEFPGAHTFDVGSPEAKRFIKDLVQELCSAFNSNYFHLGLDETFDFGKYKSKQLIEEKGSGQVMLDFYNFLLEILKKNGKEKLICYHDNLLSEEELLLNLPKDLIVFYWDYILKKYFIIPKRKYKKAKKLRENGYQVILSPTLYDYARGFPDTKRTIKNVVRMARYGEEIEALGIATSVWGDFLNENLRECNYYGYLVTAAASWSPQHWSTSRFNKNFAYFFYGIEDPDIIEAIDCLNAYNDAHSGYPVKFYSHIWRHPFPSAKKIKPKVKKLNKILKQSERALQLIAKVKGKVKRNVENLDYLAYAAKLSIYLVKKYKIPQEVQKLLNKGKGKFNPKELIKKITYLKKYLEDLRKSYEELWLRAARPNGLELILERFDASIFFYQQKIKEIKQEIIWTDPFLKAEFITAQEDVVLGEPIFLRKKFTAKGPIKRCHIQGLCDMTMELYLNGEKLTEIVSRMSLGVEPIKQRVQLIEVTDKIQEGINVISAECHNYLISRVVGNIYLELVYESGETEVVLSNSEWKATHLQDEGWEKIDFDDSHWEQAKSLGKPPNISGHITKPYIQVGIRSRESYYYATATTVKSALPWVPFFLIHLGMKVVGLDIF